MRSRLLALLAVAALLPLAGCFAAKDKAPAPAPVVSTPPAMNMTLPPPVSAPTWPHWPSDGASEKTLLEIPSFDAHKIPLTIYKPKVADAQHQVPILLHSHGFGGNRATADDAFKPLVAAGFGVVSFDERGHGDSKDDSVVMFMSPDYEVKDVSKIIDYLATLDWVLLDKPGDPRLGGIGLSYGGAFQTMGAILDGRFDAIVPEITWNDITAALAPNGAVKSAWVDAFYASGNAQGTVKFSDEFHEGFAWATASNMFPAGQAPGVPDLYSELKLASPVSYPGKLTIPTLFIQGMPDTLFPLNHAVANLRMEEAAGYGANASLYTHLGGHIFNTASLAPGTFPVDGGLQPPPGARPCGDTVALETAWHEKYLLGLNVSTGPRVCLALDDATTVVGSTFPLPGTVMQRFDVTTPTAVAEAPAGAPTAPSPVSITLITAKEDTIVAGIPVLHGNVTSPGADAIVYFSLQIPSRSGLDAFVDSQFMPLRLTGPLASATPFSLDLGGVGVRVKAGEQLTLVASTTAPIFAANAEREPGAVVFNDLHLDLPVVPPGTPSLPTK
jgi:pimeloyl-ACP methyl ester carboxylesterase